MEIFLSYASEDKATAETITFSLRGRGHTVFLDRDDLPAGESFDHQIERAVNESDIFIFLISPDSVTEGRYTLTELKFARQKWRSPNNRVLPVMARKTPLEQVPTYLKAITILEPTGNVAAETSAAVDEMRPQSSWRLVAPTLRNLWLPIAATLVVLILAFLLFDKRYESSPSGENITAIGRNVTVTPSPSGNPTGVQATGGGVAIGGNVTGATVTTTPTGKDEDKP